MEKISKILNSNIKKSGIARQVSASMVVDTFSEIVEEVLGKKVSSKVQAMYLRDKVLTVACLSSVLAQELQLAQKRILNRINKRAGSKIVEKLRFLS